MNLESANILRAGKRAVKAINDTCDASCFVWFSCSNSVPSGVCKGFALMNHQTRAHLNRILNEDDNKYIENCVNTVQRGCDAGTEREIVREVLRYLEPTQRPEGISYMLRCARGVQNAPTQESESVEQPHETGLSYPTLTRAIDPSQFPDVCDGTSCPKEYQRHCSANRPENYGRKCIYHVLTNEEMR
jgi:hypothetical protein